MWNMHPKKAAASFAWWLWLCWGRVSPGWWLLLPSMLSLGVHGRRVHGCSEGRYVSWAQEARVPSSYLNSQWINIGPKPHHPLVWVMKVSGCHCGSPGALLPPTNSTCLPCSCCPSPLPLPRPLCPLQPPNPSIPPHPGPLRPVSPVSRNALTPSPPLQNGLTPLHVAAHYDNQKVALLLLEKGASPHATAKVSQPARHEGSPGGAGPGTASGPFITAQR